MWLLKDSSISNIHRNFYQNQFINEWARKNYVSSTLGMFLVILKFKFAIYPIVNDNWLFLILQNDIILHF